MTELPATSTVQSVTLYREGALVTRAADVQLDGAGAEVLIGGLPLTLQDGSLRFEIEGEGDDLPLAVDATVELAVGDDGEAQEPAIDAALDAARLHRAKQKTLVEQLRTELAQVTELGVEERPEPEEGQPPPDSPTDARIALLEFRGAQAQRLARTLGEAEERLRVAAEELAEAKERRRRTSTAREAREHELRKQVRVRLEGGVAGLSLRLVLRYLVRGARWFPVYALRLDRDLSTARLEARAMIQQRTGEDWRGVALTLSTAAAQAWTELPELNSIRIGRSQPTRRSGWRPPPTGAGALYADHDAAFGPAHEPPPEPEYEPAPEDGEYAKGDFADDTLMDLEEADYAVSALDEAPMPGGFGGAAPPPPPAPAAIQAPMAKSMGLSLPRGGRMKKKKPARRSRREAPALQASSTAVAAMEPPAPTQPTQLRDFGVLRMAGPADARRGRLCRSTSGTPPEVRRALAHAHDAIRGPAPAGCVAPQTVGGFDFAVASDHPVDVPSDGAFHAVPVTAGEGPASARYVCVPSQSSDVFRQVELNSPLDAPVLAGPADVHVDGRYALTTSLKHRPEGGELQLGLGVEQAIKVARNVRFDETKAGLIGGSIDLEHRVDIDIKSHLGAPATLEVRERVPVTPDDEDDIVVTVGVADPEWEDWEPDERPLRGGRRWVVTVPPGGETALRATWNVRIPKGHELVGGNRREH